MYLHYSLPSAKHTKATGMFGLHGEGGLLPSPVHSGKVTSTAKSVNGSVTHSVWIRSLNQSSSCLPRKTLHQVWVRVQLWPRLREKRDQDPLLL